MASNINPYNVDGTFPIAGQDNSSQGFRDNFTNIKNNFLFAENEISDLQSKALLTSALTGQSVNNDMAGTQIRRPQLAAWTQALVDLGVTSSSAVLDFNLANFQKLTTAGSISLSFINWPTSTGAGALGYGVMRVWIVVTNASHTVTLPLNVNIGNADISGYLGNGVLTFDAPGNYIFDVSSIDGGNNFLIFDVTRNRSTFRDSNFYFNEAVTTTPTLFVGFGQNNASKESTAFAIAADQGQNIVSGLGSFNSVSFGNLTLANITNATIDTGKISGYTLTTARGNIAANVYTPVNSGDYLGYINSVSYSGYAGTANVFQQMATIAFYATGSNVTYGLGANIAFYTSQDGEVAQHGVIQAMGIENDQSVKIFGNLITAGAQVVTGYSYAAPTTNFTATIPVGVSRYIMDPTGTITNGNLQLPSITQDGTIIDISSTQTITNLGVWGGTGITVVPSANVTLTGGTGIRYFYHANESKWYKIG